MKKTPEDIARFIAEKGCIVKTALSDITSTHTKLSIQCRCGNQFTQSYRDFRQQKKFQCRKCTAGQNGAKRANKHEDVSTFISESGCKLISQYYNTYQKLVIQCSCGTQYNQTLSDFRSIRRLGRQNKCPTCAKNDKISKQTFTLDEVKDFISTTGCEMLSTSYVNQLTPIKIKCRKCEAPFTNSLKDFKNNGTYACASCTANNISEKEKQIATLLKELNFYVIENDRMTLNGKELDILIPNHNLAIEFNGVYYHSSKFKPRSYHLEKTMQCYKNGIQLLHIFDSEWNNQTKRDIWTSMILSRLNHLSHKIYARKCSVEQISSATAKAFLETNHLQGYVPSKISYGLFYQNDLVCVMSLSVPRFNKKYDFEIIRLATKKYMTVVGGASKLFKYFIRQYPSSVISYADRRYSTGNVYNQLGFNFIRFSPPSYYYTKQNRLYHRMNFQKHKLPLMLDSFDGNISEANNMKNNNYYQIWDCGSCVYEYIP